jgi:mRNA interferase MazF
MTEGNVVLTSLPQADGSTKPRPAILLRRMPFGDWLVCGVSTQLQQRVAGFDEIIDVSHPDFARSGLKAASTIGLGFLTVLPPDRLLGVLSFIGAERHKRLLQRLAAFLQPDQNP